MITSNDVKILKSERLTDEDDGGGRATGSPVVDNEMNNLFPDISRLDRTTGRISLRKVFAGVVTQTNDPYLGAHAIVTEPPQDPRVSVLLFNTDSQTDMRTDARDLVESYMAPASAATFELFGNQLQGQRAVVGIQREDQTLPEVGEVYQLVNFLDENQFVRVTSIETSIETFTHVYQNSFTTFTRRRLVLGISAPLAYVFPGGEPVPNGTSATSPITGDKKSQVLSTQVADAARYFGIAQVSQPVEEGDLSVKVDSIYSQLVPSTSRENALVSLLAGYNRNTMIPSGPARTKSLSGSSPSNSAEMSVYFGSGVAPGSVTISMSGSVYRDNSAGGMVLVSGTSRPTMSTAFLDYEAGSLTYVPWWTGAFTHSATYTPATRVTGEAITDAIPIDLGSRGYVYTLNLSEATPRPGTLVISYMALGKWYDLRDVGNGELEGEGSGTIDYATGGVAVTLTAMPDIDSAIVYSYSSSADDAVTQHTGPVAHGNVRINTVLGAGAVKPGSVTLTWKQGGEDKTATDDELGGLSGDASGYVNYASGEVAATLPTTPDAGTGIVYTYEEGSNIQEVKTAIPKDSASMATFTVAGAPFKPGSVELQFMVSRLNTVPTGARNTNVHTYEVNQNVMVTVKDNGAGGWVGRAGTINYTTGQCWVLVEQDYDHKIYHYYVVPTYYALAGA